MDRNDIEDSLVRRLRQFQADEPGFPPLFSKAASEIERLKQRIAVLEMVVMEEIDECQYEANQMIVDDVRDRHSPTGEHAAPSPS